MPNRTSLGIAVEWRGRDSERVVGVGVDRRRRRRGRSSVIVLRIDGMLPAEFVRNGDRGAGVGLLAERARGRIALTLEFPGDAESGPPFARMFGRPLAARFPAAAKTALAGSGASAVAVPCWHRSRPSRAFAERERRRVGAAPAPPMGRNESVVGRLQLIAYFHRTSGTARYCLQLGTESTQSAKLSSTFFLELGIAEFPLLARLLEVAALAKAGPGRGLPVHSRIFKFARNDNCAADNEQDCPHRIIDCF
jgi:hypothetical protein